MDTMVYKAAIEGMFFITSQRVNYLPYYLFDFLIMVDVLFLYL